MRIGSCNLKNGTVDVADLASVPDVDAWVLQEAKHWDRDGRAALHRARERVAAGGTPWAGFLAPSAHHGCHIAILVREHAGLRVVEERHDQGPPWWHVLANLRLESEEFGELELLGLHLAPSAPAIRRMEGETFGLFRSRRVIAVGDCNALPASGPEPDLSQLSARGREKADGKLKRGAARAIEAAGFVDVGALLGGPGGQEPTVGHDGPGKLAYACDRAYTTLPAEQVRGFEVLDLGLSSDHRPIVVTVSP